MEEVLKYDLFSQDNKNRLSVYTSAQNTQRDSYYGANQDPNAFGKTKDLTFIGGAQYVHDFDKLLFMPADFTFGSEYTYDHLEDNMIGYNRAINQTVNIESAFAQNEWKNDKWSFLLGGRLDKHNMIDRVIFNPRANLRYNLTKDINFRLSYSSGFRAPQTYDEDLHVSSVNGEMMMIQNAKNLKEETSNSISSSIDMYHRIGLLQLNFLVEGFYTNLSNQFQLVEIGTNDQGYLINERRNGSGARVMGLSFEGKAAYDSWLQLQAGITLQKSENKESQQWSADAPKEKKLFRTPNTYGYFTSTVTPVKHFSASLSGTYTGSMLSQHFAGYIDKDVAVSTPDFFNMNLKLFYDIKFMEEISLQLNAGVQNLFDAFQSDLDKGINRDSKYIYGPTLPRSYFVGAKFSF